MASGISLFLIAVGAILYFAVSETVEGLALETVGVILMIVGAAGLVISLVMLATGRARSGGTTIVRDTTSIQGGTTDVQHGRR